MGSPRGLVPVLSTGVLALSVGTASHAREARLPERIPTTTAASRGLALPLGLAPDARTLVDANGEPFILRGRTAWYILSLSVAGQTTFLDDTAEKRFNAIEIKAITHDENGNNPPFAGNGEVPFVTRLDGTTRKGRTATATTRTPPRRCGAERDAVAVPRPLVGPDERRVPGDRRSRGGDVRLLLTSR